MIAKRFFETARVLIYDPVASNRNATRASLHSLGYRNVDAVAALDMLTTRLQTEPPDLLLTEVAGAESETCALIQAVRQGQLADNPFIVVIATTWRRDGSIIGQVVNSGADDLVPADLHHHAGERVRLLAERRKGFVVRPTISVRQTPRCARRQAQRRMRRSAQSAQTADDGQSF